MIEDNFNLGDRARYHQLAQSHLSRGELTEAIACYQKVLEIEPDSALSHWQLGDLLNQTNQPSAAWYHKQQALSLQPSLVSAETHNQVGLSLAGQGGTLEAIAWFQRAISVQPEYIDAHYNLGIAWAEQGNLSEAIACFHSVITLNPRYINALLNLSALLAQQHQTELANSWHMQAQDLQQTAEKILQQGINDSDRGNYEPAISCFQEVLTMQPHFAEAHYELGFARSRLGKSAEAILSLQTAIALQPDFSKAFWRMSFEFSKLKNYPQWRQLVNQYLQACGITDVVRCRVAWLSAHLFSGLSNAALLREFNILEDFVWSCPNFNEQSDLEILYSNGLFIMFCIRDDAIANSRLAKFIGNLYGELVLKPNFSDSSFSNQNLKLTSTPQQFQTPSESLESSLRIGFLSPHFKRHSVGWCSGDIIVELAKITPHIYLYVTNEMVPDDRTAMFERAAAKMYWYESLVENRFKVGLEASNQIRQSDLDILIDLDSLTILNNSMIMYQSPAPVCISWLGFDAPFMSAHNYCLSDRHTHPPEFDALYLEKIIRMPDAHMAVSGFACIEMDVDSERQKYGIAPDRIVYLFSALGRKLNEDTVKAIISILKYVPNSILLCKCDGDSVAISALFTQICELKGVSSQRIKFLPRTNTEEEHRVIYSLADVMLDAYPYNGGTHSLEALWFNLPLITFAGQQSFARMGYSFLQTLGINAGIGHSWEEYTDWGIKLGLDRELRLSIKHQLQQSKHPNFLSPLWNPQKFAQDLYAILKNLRFGN